MRSLLAVLVIVPLAAVALAYLLEVPAAVRIALIVLAISPLPPLLPRRESKAGGRQSYGLSLMALLGALSIAYVPLALALLSSLFDRPLAMGPGRIARLVLLSVLLPLVAGVAVRARFPGVAERIASPVALLAKVLLVLGLLALFAGVWRAVWAAIGDGSVVTVVLFTAIALLVGHVLGGPEPDNAVVLALSSASRHPAIALSIAATNVPEERAAGTILLFLIVSGIVGIPYLAWHQRRITAAVAPA
jgi:BASS family bile acid:Na+ symporter